jgi:AraC-like DNA-binding protein
MKLYFFIRLLEVTSWIVGGERRSGKREHELFFCVSGRGFLNHEGKKNSIAPGDLLFNPRGRLISEGNSLRTGMYQILFSEELFSPAVLMEKEALYVLGLIKIQARSRNTITLSKIGSERVQALCESMLGEFQKRYRGYSWAIRLKLIELLISVMRDKQFGIPIRSLRPISNSHIQDVVLYLNADYMNPISVDDILKICPLSRSHFHALFKRETGRTLTAYLQTLRCRKAAELLRTTGMTIIDIAETCGFSNLSHFYHCFKRKYGVAPGLYRNSDDIALDGAAL